MAIVAAAKIYDVDPTRVFEDGFKHPKTRALAGAALIKAGLSRAAPTARALGLAGGGKRLAPHALGLSHVRPTDIQAVADQLRATFPVAEATDDEDDDAPPTAPVVNDRPAAPKPAPAREVPAFTPGLRFTAPAEPIEPAPRLNRERRGATVQAMAQAVSKLRPLSDAVVRYARFFAQAGWAAETVAWLFDVDPCDLRARLRGEGYAIA